MRYNPKLLERWFETRAEVFIQQAGRGLLRGKSISEEDVRKEFKIIAQELGMILEAQRKEPVEAPEPAA